jgi:glycosyltransferase involved in cell wall biosynthesis
MSGASEGVRRPATFAAVIPTYQRERTVGRAIESVLQQTRPADEVIVVDDGSTDGTGHVLDGFPSVRVIRQEQAGSAAARNHGVRAASSTWIAFLDSDDWWEADHLERIARAVEQTGGAADLYLDDTHVALHTQQGEESQLYVGSLWELAHFAPSPPVDVAVDASEWVLLPVQPTMLQSSAIRRERYLELGGLWDRLVLRHDTHLFLRLGLGRTACAVSGVGARMSDDGGDARLTRLSTPDSKAYWDETALLYNDVLLQGAVGKHARRVLTERLAVAHWRRARIALETRGARAAARPLAAALRARPGVVFGRLASWAGRRDARFPFRRPPIG